MRRTRFQQGSLQIVKRARGRNAWEYRWYELQADGSRKRRCLIIGSVEQYPNEASAQKAVAALRADINAENPRTSLSPISVQTLIEHYREKELGANCSKTRKTQVTYAGYFRKWILPRCGSYHVTYVKAVAVEQWLRSLQYANGIKAKARNIMSAVFNHAVRWEWLDENPIRIVRQSAKRTRMPIVLSIEQRPKPLASRFRSTCDYRRYCGTGGCRVHTQPMRTGYSPVRTAAENCRTGRVRSTRRTWNRRRKKSESWVISVGTHSGIRTRRSSRGTARM
jgi:hypothetical protein